MATSDSQLQAIHDRIVKLERENRKLRWSALILLLMVSGVILMGQAKPAARIVEAQKFVLKDENGKVRAWMGLYGTGSELMLGNDSAQPMMRLIVSTDAGNLHFYGSHKGGMTLAVDSGDPSLSIVDADGNGGAAIAFSKDGPGLTLVDGKGFSAVVGATQLKDSTGGDAKHTSAASIVLLDKAKMVLWRAP
ncbi:MAG: hypothetical protein ACRD59_03125 [Candidatus Acidiferrales bacterium]